MSNHQTALERAFQLARSGDYTLTTLRAKLQKEGYLAAQISGQSLLRQLRTLCMTSAAAKAGAV